MVIMQRPYKPSDRSKTKIYTATEVVYPKRAAGMLVVEVQKESAVLVLKKKGFKVVEKKQVVVKAKPAPVVEKPKAEKKVVIEEDVRRSLYAKTVAELRNMARKLNISGRSKMNEAELVDAIMAAGEES